MTKPEKLLRFLLDVAHRPAMYHIESVHDLRLIVLGYQHAVEASDLPKLNELMDGFRVFVNQQLEGTHNTEWARLIMFNASDSAHSIELFKRLFHEYLDTLSLGYGGDIP